MVLYVYGASRAEDPEFAVSGIDDCPVRTVRSGRVGALVSEVARPPSAARKCVESHARVLEAAMSYGPVVPYRFGHSVDQEAELTAHLRSEGRRLRATLDRLAGQVELLVNLRRDSDALLREVLLSDRRLQRLQESTRHSSDLARRIEFGRAISDAVERRRGEDVATLIGQLKESVTGAVIEPGSSEWSRVGLLVGRQRTDEVRRRIEELAGNGWGLRISGPLPPYHFAAA